MSDRERVTDIDFIQETADIMEFKGEVFLRDPLVPYGTVGRKEDKESAIFIDMNKEDWPDIREAYHDEEFRNVFAHEMVHTVQAKEEIRADYNPKTTREMEDGRGYVRTDTAYNMSFLREGQATALAGSINKVGAYDCAAEVYREGFSRFINGENFGEALKELNDELYLATLILGRSPYHLALGTDEVKELEEEEIYNRFVREDTKKYPNFEETEFKDIDLRDDARIRGQILRRTHYKVAEAYERACERGNELLLEQLNEEILTGF